MKRWLFLIVVVLLLAGCAAEEEVIPTTEPVPTAVQTPTEPTGYYDPDSALEASTDGAVRIYPLNRTDSYGLVPMGEDLLLLSGTEVTTLTRLTGSNLYVSAAANLGCYVDVESPSFQVSEKGVTYYDALHRELVFLDAGLKEANRVSLPETILGSPALSADRKQLYYFTAENLRCLDLESGLDRMLKEIFFPHQTLDGLHLDDTVLECSVMDSDGNCYGYYISTETGETLWETLGDNVTLWTHGNSYFAIHFDGECRELLIGSPNQEPILLNSPVYNADAAPALQIGGALLSSTTEEASELSYYDLESGTRLYALSLPGANSALRNIQADPDGYYIWFLRYDDAYGSDTLCRWELAQTPTGDETVYTSSRYTRESPDTDGINACNEIAAAIGKKHNVEILLWTSAVRYQPEGYRLGEEYQAPLITHCLQQLDQALSRYPSDFLKEAAAGSAGGKIKICLVRSIFGNADANVPDQANGLQYWDDKGNAYVAVTPGINLESSLYHELFHVIDSRVMSTCSAYDNWAALNPEDFAYSYDYTTQPEWDEALLDGEEQTFIDTYAMISPREDRARIMEYAMMSGFEISFESAPMQAKLRQLCEGIREAFGLEESTETYLWEQYLTEPLT